MNLMKNIALVILISLSTSGCLEYAGYQFAENSEFMNKVYSDPESDSLKDSEIAILENNTRVTIGGTIVVEKMDRYSHDEPGRITKYRLLPGEHTVTATYMGGTKVGGPISLTFIALAGRVYELIAGGDGEHWSLSVVEKSSRKVVD